MNKQEIISTLLNNEDPAQAMQDFHKEKINEFIHKWIGAWIVSLVISVVICVMCF